MRVDPGVKQSILIQLQAGKSLGNVQFRWAVCAVLRKISNLYNNERLFEEARRVDRCVKSLEGISMSFRSSLAEQRAEELITEFIRL